MKYSRRSLLIALAAGTGVALSGPQALSAGFRRRRRTLLSRRIKQVADQKFASGEITVEQHKKVISGCLSPEVMKRTLNAMEVEPGLWGLPSIDWGRIIEWIRENWVQILKLIFSLLIFI